MKAIEYLASNKLFGKLVSRNMNTFVLAKAAEQVRVGAVNHSIWSMCLVF